MHKRRGDNKYVTKKCETIRYWRLLLMEAERWFSSGQLTFLCLHVMKTDKICSRWLSNFSPQLPHHQSGVSEIEESFIIVFCFFKGCPAYDTLIDF